MVRIDLILLIAAIIVGLIGYLPLFPYLDPFAKWGLPASLLFALYVERWRGPVLRGRPATLATVGIFLLYLFQARSGEIVNPAVNLLVAVLVIRFIGEKSTRHLLQIYALSLFTLAASTVFTLSPAFLPLMMFQLLVICFSLVMLTAAGEDFHEIAPGELWKISRAAAFMPAVAFPLMIVFFAILPRTQFPLWNVLPVSGARTTGLSDQVRPGAAASFGETKNVAFRAAGPKAVGPQPYWRAVVFNTFVDGSWKYIEPPAGERETPLAGERVTYTIYAEPSPHPFVVVPDAPVSVSGIRGWRMAEDLVVTAPSSAKRSRYEVTSIRSEGVRRKGAPPLLYRHWPLHSPRFQEIAARVGEAGDAEAKIAALESEFVSRRIGYSLTGLPTGEKALEEFFFNRRIGHCELFASTAAMILRLAGVPARLVGGYLGGEYNDIAGYYVVTEDKAHVWVEAFVEGKGWVRVDPSAWATNFGTMRQKSDSGFFRKVTLAVDSLNYFWNQAVTTYDLDKQIRLVQAAGARAASIRAPKVSRQSLSSGAAIAAAAIAGFLIFRHRRKPAEQVLVGKFITRVRKVYGEDCFTPAIPLLEGAAATKDVAAMEFAALYSAAIFHDRRLSTDEIRRLRKLIKTIGSPVKT